MTDPVVVTVTPPPGTTVEVVVEAAHAQAVGFTDEIEFFPPHPPRQETAEYIATHHLLTHVLDTPCRFCGVRLSTLKDPTANLFGSHDLETHHYPIQRELADACDWRKVARDFPTQVVDRASFLKFVDSPANMWVVCDVCHRGRNGVHHDVIANTAIRKYLLDGYVLTGKGHDAAVDLATDEKIVDASVPLAERL